MGADCFPADRPARSSYAVGILVGVLFWLTGCQGLQKQAGNAEPVDPFLQSGPVGSAPDQAARKPTKNDAIANAAVPAPKTSGLVTSAAVPAPKPGPTMTTPGGSAARLLPPDTLSPGTATLVSGNANFTGTDDRASATLQPPLQQADWQGGGQTVTLDEALRQVQLRNVSAQKLEKRGGKWCFSCEVPAPTAEDPKASKLYEAEADRDVDAVQAVLVRIDQDQPRK